MTTRRRQVAIPLLLAGGALAVAFLQRPGFATADTKINLHVDPGRFLADVASMWSSSGQLGGVQAGQQAGYLFPMGPFFAAGHALGVSDWVVQRLWLGALLALAAWGTVRLLDALLDRPRGVPALAAGAVIVLNPFVVTYANRTTVTLLAYAALPWLLLAVHRGLREPGGWGWPAAVALLVAASGGGVNGAVTAWMLLGPVLLLLYEVAFAAVPWRAVRAFALRAVPLTLVVSLWWLVPAYVQSAYGADFLRFTEQPGTVWGTTSSTETLRLMSFWLSYVGLGFAGRAIPYFDDARTMLFSVPVVVSTLLVPAVALCGFVWTRRWRYGPFFLLLGLVALLVMGAGFPDGTPLRHGLTFTYNHVALVRFLRASYKGAPLLAVAVACLFGVAAGEAWTRLAAVVRPAAWRSAAIVTTAAIVALAAWPLVNGSAQDAQVSFKRIPAAWRNAAADLDRQLAPNARALVLPGELFSFYTWGGTVDPILPALSSRPVAVRSQVPYSDPRAADLLWTIDGLVHQQRLLPGQLAPLLDLISARAVITGTDDDPARSDAPPPADIAAELAAQPGLAAPARSYGPVRRFTPTGLGVPVALPQVRRYDLPQARGVVRVEPRASPVIVDGSAGALAQMAAFGMLPTAAAIRYAGDLSTAQLRDALAAGGSVVISDSNRRRAFVSGSLEQNVGPTLSAQESVSADGILLDPFKRGTDFETVADLAGIRSVLAPASPQIPQFPEHAPFAAIDGSPATAWLADSTLGAGRAWLQVNFEKPIAVPYVDLLPYGTGVRTVSLAGRMFRLHAGWNRLTLGLRSASSLRVTLGGRDTRAADSAAGISELRIPGVRAAQLLRAPVDTARALRGADLNAVSLNYLFERTTGDDPFRRDLVRAAGAAPNVHDPGDGEQEMRRTFELPSARSFTAQAWVHVFSGTADDTLDRLAGYRGPVIATSSGRVDGIPGLRASRALDRDPQTAWITHYRPGRPAWLQFRGRGTLEVRSLRLVAPTVPVGVPAEVRLSWPGGATPPLAVSPGGLVRLPSRVRASTLRLDILTATAQAGATAAQRSAVGIAEVRGIEGLPPIPRAGAREFTTRCGAAAIEIGARRLALRVGGSISAFDAGRPLRATSCGRPLALAAGVEVLGAEPGPFAVDELRLDSPATQRVPVSPTSTGRVLDAGRHGRGSYDHVRLAVTGPSWLVLGEGYDRGWQAWCNGRSLGRPVAIDGYANGWPVGAGCRDVRFSFTPNRLAAVGYLVSVLAGLACALLLASRFWRRRRRGVQPAATGADALPRLGPERVVPVVPARALAVSALAGVAFGFVFGVAAGLVAVPVLTLILWRGIGTAQLTLVAGALLGIAVPILYVAHPGTEAGGNHYSYAVQHMAAHWVGVAAIGLLTVALWRTLAALRRREP